MKYNTRHDAISDHAANMVHLTKIAISLDHYPKIDISVLPEF